MIRQLDIDDRNIEAARKVTDALGFLRQTPTGGIVISASNGSVTIEASAMRSFVDLVASVLETGRDAELSPQEAAQRLRMSRPTVMRLIARGELPARRVGSHYRLTEKDVSAFDARQTTVRRQSLDDMAAFSQDFDQ